MTRHVTFFLYGFITGMLGVLASRFLTVLGFSPLPSIVVGALVMVGGLLWMLSKLVESG